MQQIADFKSKSQSLLSKLSQPLTISPTYASKVNAALDILFAGKTPQEIAKAKSDIMNEVNKRYGKYAWLMKKAQAFLDEQASKRASKSAPPSPLPAKKIK